MAQSAEVPDAGDDDSAADADVDAAAEVDVEAPASSTSETRPSRPLALIGLAVLLVLALTTIFVQWRRVTDLDHRIDSLQAADATRREIASAASAFGEALLSYDFNDLNAARTRVLALATESFGQQYTTAFTGGLDIAITKLQATSKATVDSVYISDAIGDTAKAVVTLDSEVHSTAGIRRTVGSYLDLTLKRENGVWKVDTVTSVAALDQQTIAPDGSVSNSSTTPSTVVPGVPDTTTATSAPSG
jgi:Mce-associated membrane protein